jgi:uncharacterized damage-inducible protein DinB
MQKDSMLILRDAVCLMMLRDLRALDREIAAYPDDETLWLTPNGISNSAGNLALHVAGNLQHFIGARLGDSGYVRNREKEFATRAATRAELVAELVRAKQAVHAALSDRDPASAPPVFPDQIAGKTMTSEVFLLHLVAHLAYHLGQVDYHRRITTGDAKTVDTVSVSTLPNAVST